MLELEVEIAVYFWPFMGTIASSMAYMVVVSLYCSCFRALLKGVPLSSAIKREFMFIYITLIQVLTTCSLVQQLYSIITSLFHPDPTDIDGSEFSAAFLQQFSVLLPFLMWAADGFMVWRCFVLYQNTSAGYRTIVIGLLLVSSLALVGVGLLDFLRRDTSGFSALLFASCSIFSNIALSILIVSRLLYHQKYLRSVLGVGHGSVYTRIMTLCVESCALIIFILVAYIIMDFTECGAKSIPLFLLPHIYAISALMIVHRVAQGIESTTTIPPPSGVVHRPAQTRIEESIQFNTRVTSEVGRESV